MDYALKKGGRVAEFVKSMNRLPELAAKARTGTKNRAALVSEFSKAADLAADIEADFSKETNLWRKRAVELVEKKVKPALEFELGGA